MASESAIGEAVMPFANCRRLVNFIETWPLRKRAPGSSDAKAATILLSLRIENNSNFVRGKKRATEDIERYCLGEYNAKRRPDGEYELKLPYSSD